MKETFYTPVLLCRHCGNSAPLEVVAEYRIEHGTDDGSGPPPDTVGAYWTCICPACKRVVFVDIDYTAFAEEPPIRVLYPARPRNQPKGLPASVATGLRAAQKVRDVDANAYAVLLGRVLELVCKDRAATGRTLADKLQSLSERNEIPSRLAAIAHSLRRLRNVGAHADLGDLTSEELPVLDNLTLAILEYVYSAPQLVAEAEECLARLKATESDETAIEN